MLGTLMVMTLDAVSLAQQIPSLRRSLPAKVIVGYSSHCYNSNSDSKEYDKVQIAVRQGANVVIWAFFPHHLDTDCIQRTIQMLDQEGYDDVIHLTSVGGWSGGHLNESMSSQSWYEDWRDTVGDFVHGIDFDFEGNDNMTSPMNYMSINELDMAGEIAILAKQDGYVVTMAPPQSYFDIHVSSFSQFLNLTDVNRTWHADFSYFGRNLYAYWMANYGDSIDLVMVQFYESYSRSSMMISQGNFTPENYLQQYVWDLNQPSQGPGWWVDFGKGAQFVPVPVSKLVWGLCNAWCNTDNGGRHYFFAPVVLNAAYQNLWDWMLEPRGFMFWEIHNEGEEGIYYARGLNSILHIRSFVTSHNSISSQ